MNEFLKLNKHKLPFAFISTSLAFLAIALVFLAIAYFNNQFPDLSLLIIILLVAGIGFPVFIIMVAYLEWLSKRRLRIKAFSVKPFDQLDKIGFTKSFINEKNKLYFTEETKEGIFNDFRIICDVTRKNPKTIQFKALIKHKQIEEDDLKKLENQLKTQNIVFDFDGIIKMYNLKRLTIHSIIQLESDLVKFTELLKKQNFEPEK